MNLAVLELERLFGDRLTWRERMAGGPDWLTWELCATETARDKLKAWMDTTPRPWTNPSEETILQSAAFVCDERVLAALCGVLRALPPPVTAYALARVTYIGLGVRTVGSCGGRPDFGDRPWVVMLSAPDGTPESVFRIAAHEVAHSWLEREPSFETHCMFAIDQWAINTARLDIVEKNRPEAADRCRESRAGSARIESRAARLVRSWGFDNIPSR